MMNDNLLNGRPDKRNGHEPVPKVERALSTFYHRPAPDPLFVNRLERQLLSGWQSAYARQAARPGPAPRPGIFSLFKPLAWGAAALLLVGLLVLSILFLIPRPPIATRPYGLKETATVALTPTPTISPAAPPAILPVEPGAPTPTEIPPTAVEELPAVLTGTITIDPLEDAKSGQPVPGALYFVLSDSARGGYRLVRVLTNCLVNNASCPGEIIISYPETEYGPLSWSPDGSAALLYSSNQSALYLFAPLDYYFKIIANNLQLGSDIKLWSPDGNWIALTVLQPGSSDSQITILSRDGTDKRTPTGSLGGLQIPLDWLDNETILFLYIEPGTKGQPAPAGAETRPGLYKLNIQTQQWTELSYNPDWFKSYPAASPDGQQIAYSSQVNGRSELFVMNVDGTQNRALNVPGRDALWSENGQWIAAVAPVETGTESRVEVYLVRADGSEVRKLFEAPVYPVLSWAPDSTHLVAEVGPDPNVPGSISSIYLLATDGSQPRRIDVPLAAPADEYRSPSWEPPVYVR